MKRPSGHRSRSSDRRGRIWRDARLPVIARCELCQDHRYVSLDRGVYVWQAAGGFSKQYD